jgi:hypothetical protein
MVSELVALLGVVVAMMIVATISPVYAYSQEDAEIGGGLTTVEPGAEIGAGMTLDEPGLTAGNKSEPMRWLIYDDPILQQNEDIVSFEIPDTYSDFDVIVEPLLTLDHSEYARDTLNERRKYSLEIVGLNETSINGQPATMAQYDSAGTMTLSYFMVTDDYTGYRLLYAPDFRDDNSSQRTPTIEKMANSFRITK